MNVSTPQDHFELSQYENKRADNLRRLKASAVPTLFPTSTTLATVNAFKNYHHLAPKRPSRKKLEVPNTSDNKTNAAHNATPPAPPPFVFTEHSYCNRIGEGKLEGAAGNGFQNAKVLKPDFTNENSFLPSEPVPDASFSFPSASSSLIYVFSPAFPSFSSSCSGKDEEVIVKKEENLDIRSADSVSGISAHYSHYFCGKKVKGEKMCAVGEDAVQKFLCEDNDCKVPQESSSDESLFTIVGISTHDVERPATKRGQTDPNTEGGREKSGNDDNSGNEKIPEQKLNIIIKDAKQESLNLVQRDPVLDSCSVPDQRETKKRNERIEHMIIDGKGTEAENMAHTDKQFETELGNENDEDQQDSKREEAALAKYYSSEFSLPCPDHDRLAMMEQKVKELEQALIKQRRKMYKVKKQKLRQEHLFAEVFTKDQLACLRQKNRRGVKWSKETIRKALLLLSACRPLGYKALLSQKMPLPSLGLLRRLRKTELR